MTWRQAFSQDFESGHPISGTVMPFILGQGVLHWGGGGVIFWPHNACVLNECTLKISRITLVHYCKYCNLIGYSTCYLFLDRHFPGTFFEKIASSSCFSMFFVQYFMFDL